MKRYKNLDWGTLLLLIIFILGFAIRIYDLKDAPLDFHPTRQLHSALMARGMYFSIAPQSLIPEWQQTTSIRQWKMEGMVEPPILEWLVAISYRMVGGVFVWIARLYAIGFWLLAALGVWLIMKAMVGKQGALAGLVYFLFYPYGVYASRSFQPETLLVLLLVFSTWAAIKWIKNPSWKWAVTAGLLAGFAILVKAVAIFFVSGIWFGLLLSQMKISEILKSRQLWIIGLLCFLPYGSFLVYANFFIEGYAGQFSLRFFPQMWTQVGFYLNWIGTLKLSVGFEWLVLGLLGILLVKEKPLRWILVGAWIGYLAFGLTLPYHISSHDYYNLPMYPVIAIGLAVVIQSLFNQNPNRQINIGMTLVLLMVIAVYSYETYNIQKRTNYDSEVRFWQSLGQRVGNSSKVVALSEDYGYRLAYWGWNSPANWMSSEDIRIRQSAGQNFNFDETFSKVTEGRDYFIVTLPDELERQPLLKQKLQTYSKILYSDNRTTIYDLKTSN